jgi:hypothetical protein
MSAVSTGRRKGVSLAKGPIAILGVLGIAMGVLGLVFGGHGFHLASVPHGSIYGKRWLGIELNGWTNLLFIAAGLFLLLFSPAHWGAKAAAWIVAIVLGAAAIIAVIRGNGIFGIFAADHRTEIIWGAAAIVLLVLSLLPRVGRREPAPPVARTRRRERSAARSEPLSRTDERAVGDEPAVPRHDRGVPGDEPALADRREAARDESQRIEPHEEDEAATSERSAASQRDADDTANRPAAADDELVSPREDSSEGDDAPEERR